MESMEQEKTSKKKGHTCPADGHCCACEGCGSYAAHGGMHHHELMKRYWVRHFIVLILGVMAAFFIGYNIGKMKGYIMANFGSMPMQHNQVWTMRGGAF